MPLSNIFNAFLNAYSYHGNIGLGVGPVMGIIIISNDQIYNIPNIL